MTTTPLPPLPRITEDPFRYYTADQMQAYAQQARADLEAENKRLREALVAGLAHLVAAHSLLERGGKKAAASAAVFQIMLDDLAKAIDAGRAALKDTQ